MTQMPFLLMFLQKYISWWHRCLDILFLSLKLTCPAVSFCVLQLRTSKYMQLPMMQISYCRCCFFFLLVKLCFCPVFTCPSMSYYRLLSHCDFQVHFLIAQISQVITGCLVFTVSSRDQRILCQALVTFKYTSCWRRYQILALYYCCLRLLLILLSCPMQQKKPSHLQVTWHQFNAM